MEKLKPCRCCGKTPVLFSVDGSKPGYLLSCNDEDCEGFIAVDDVFDTVEEAIKAWNEREDA